MKRLFWMTALALVLAASFSARANAQEPTPTDDQVNRIAKQLYCPVCENTPLDVCPTEACRQWRELIRLQLSQGRTEDEIKEYFVVNYGARVLAEPPRTGLNWLVYLLPPLLILGGAFFLLRALQNWTKRPASAAKSAAEPPGDEYLARLEEELRKRK